MLNVAIIDENEIYYNDMNKTQSNYTTDVLEDKLEDYITFKQFNTNLNIESIDDQVLHLIVNEVAESNNKYTIHTGIVSHIYDELYLICHIRPTKELYDEFKLNKEKFNGIASYLSDDGLRLYKKAVLLKLDTHNNINKIVNITMRNIIDVFASKFVHRGISVDHDNTLDEFQYMFNPIDKLSAEFLKKYKYYEREIFGKSLLIFHDTESKNKNEAGSILSGYPVYGRCYIGLRDISNDMHDTEWRYSDLDKEILQKLIMLSHKISESKINKNYFELQINESIGCEIIDNNRIYNNFYKILHTR